MISLFAAAFSMTMTANAAAAVRHEMALTGTLGEQVTILERGQVVYKGSFGIRSKGGPPVDAHTRFEIGSDTKQFTAAAILQLKERGLLRLDDPLSKYVPTFPHASKITLRQLLDQTSGLFDYVETNHFLEMIQRERGSFERIEGLASAPLLFKPGTHWKYSNTNYIALGRVIEVVSREPYETYVRRHLFARAGMHESGFASDEAALRDVATGYWRGMHGGSALVPAPELGESWLWSAGGIVSTAGDIAKWDTALLSGKIIAHADFVTMTTPATLSDGQRDDYGFGWWIDPVDGHTDIYHDGDTIGMSSSNDIFPHDGVTVIVLANQAGDVASKTARAIFSVIDRSSLKAATGRANAVISEGSDSATSIRLRT